jgi:REP element-mobilizing transposase RayT
MIDKYKGKYRIPSARLKNWDYGSNPPYFVTIYTENKNCYFGNIKDGEMHLSDLGQLANTYWLEIKNKFPFVVLDYFIVMPNHIHVIINIDKKLIIDDCRDAIYRVSNSSISDENVNITDAINQDAINRVSTLNRLVGLLVIIIQCCMKIYHVLFIGIKDGVLLK